MMDWRWSYDATWHHSQTRNELIEYIGEKSDSRLVVQEKNERSCENTASIVSDERSRWELNLVS